MFLLAVFSGIAPHESGMLAFTYTLDPWKWHVNASYTCQLAHADFVINLNLHLHDQTDQNIPPFMVTKFSLIF